MVCIIILFAIIIAVYIYNGRWLEIARGALLQDLPCLIADTMPLGQGSYATRQWIAEAELREPSKLS